MKNFIKNNLIGIIIGEIIFGTLGVIAATTISSQNVTYQNKTVNTALDELYNEATTGKELVAAAITNKGVATTSSDTYETMATNINGIDTDHTEIIGKISNLESKHNTDIASLSGSISNITQELNNLDKNVYSQTETKIGKWIDNRNIYRKVIFLSSSISISYTDWTDSKIPTSDFDIILNAYCIAKDNLSFHYLSSSVTNATLNFMVTRTFPVNTDKIILEYVKK